MLRPSERLRTARQRADRDNVVHEAMHAQLLLVLGILHVEFVALDVTPRAVESLGYQPGGAMSMCMSDGPVQGIVLHMWHGRASAMQGEQ